MKVLFLNWSNFFFFFFLCLLFMVFMCPLSVDISYFNLYVDSLSFSLALLSVYLILMMILSMIYVTKVNEWSYLLFIFFILGLTLVLSFMVNNFLLFYFFFEFSLIPTILLIMGWGGQPERLESSYYFFFYTLGASLPLLICIIYMYGSLGSSFFIYNDQLGGLIKGWFFLFFLMAFLVKLPLFLFHLWLPKAHVEAPVCGSMILAGVLLKLGGYGVIRVGLSLVSSIGWANCFLISLSMVGMIVVGLLCCRLNDLKSLIAYSSVAHMAVMLGGMITYSHLGMVGGLMLMLAHGLCSSGLFCLVNLFYERFMSRSIFLIKGVGCFYGIMGLYFFILLVGNISGPPSLNYFSEILLLYSLLSYNYMLMVLFFFGSFMGAVYSVYLFSFSQHGKSNNFYALTGISSREFHLLSMHCAPLFMVVLWSFNF